MLICKLVNDIFIFLTDLKQLKLKMVSAVANGYENTVSLFHSLTLYRSKFIIFSEIKLKPSSTSTSTSILSATTIYSQQLYTVFSLSMAGIISCYKFHLLKVVIAHGL